MATYKVIQDVEAEDKLLGPLSLRQFIYAAITASALFICYMALSRMGSTGMALVVFLLPIALFFGFLAFPWNKDQPTELWALARINFLYRPRKRFWDQSGIRELVTITVPKALERHYTDGLTQTEVQSRLQALASTLDSRGWAVKNPTMVPYLAPAYAAAAMDDDRLVAMGDMPREVPEIGQEAYADMLDPTNNRVAEQFASMLDSNERNHRQKLVASMQAPTAQATPPTAPAATPSAPAPDYWFMNQNTTLPAGASTFGAQVVAPGAQSAQALTAAPLTDEEEQALVEELKAKELTGQPAVYAHLPTILPLAEQERLAREAATRAAEDAARAAAAAATAPNPTIPAQNTAMTDEADAAILELSRNDDLNIETLARQAKKAHDDDEVVISLH